MAQRKGSVQDVNSIALLFITRDSISLTANKIHSNSTPVILEISSEDFEIKTIKEVNLTHHLTGRQLDVADALLNTHKCTLPHHTPNFTA